MISRISSVIFLLAIAMFGFTQNPIIQTKYTADPAPLVHRDTVFLYTSHDEDDAPPGQGRFLMRDWLCYASTDMVNWTDRGVVASLRNFKWADKSISGWGGFDNGAWAPQVIERNGKFFMYCPVQGRGIGVLVADRATGPFIDPLGKPLIGGQFDSIDPTVFIDDNGQAYLYWGNPNLWFVKLNTDMISLQGAIIKDSSFAKVSNQPDPFHYQEGPWIFKRNNNYYLAYATTCCPEGIGYAMSKGPEGPWQFKGYIMKPDKRSTGNHPGIIDFKGRSYVFGFHFKLNFMQTSQHHERRSVCVEEFQYNADGTIPQLPWWRDEGIRPTGTPDPSRRVEAETIAWAEGVKTATDSLSGNIYLTDINSGNYIKIRGVDLKKARRELLLRVAPLAGGVIEFRLDSLSGKLAGSCKIEKKNPSTWTTVSSKLSIENGVHDVYLVFRGGEGLLFNFDWWMLK